MALAPDALSSFTMAAPVTVTRSGRAVRLVQDDGGRVQPTANTAIINLMIKARRWWKILREGELHIKQLAAAEGVQAAYITRVVRLRFCRRQLPTPRSRVACGAVSMRFS